MDINTNQLFEVYRQKEKIYVDLYHQQKITIYEYRTFRFIQTLAEFNKVADESTATSFERLYASISKSFMKVNQDLLNILFQLHKKYKLGIVTNGTSKIQHDKINTIGIKPIFSTDTIFISEEVGHEKPSAVIYKKALEYFQVRSDETLFVGDSWNNDVEGPFRLGIKSIWLNKKEEKPKEHAKPIAIANDMNELVNHLTNFLIG
jgi:putative hydrolase of the HAD superfamily